MLKSEETRNQSASRLFSPPTIIAYTSTLTAGISLAVGVFAGHDSLMRFAIPWALVSSVALIGLLTARYVRAKQSSDQSGGEEVRIPMGSSRERRGGPVLRALITIAVFVFPMVVAVGAGVAPVPVWGAVTILAVGLFIYTAGLLVALRKRLL